MTITHDWSPLALAFSAVKSRLVNAQEQRHKTWQSSKRGATLLFTMEAFNWFKKKNPLDQLTFFFLSCHFQQYFTSLLVQEFKVCKIHLEWLPCNLVNLDLNCQILHKHILSFYKRSVCKSSCIGTEAGKEICFTLPVYLRRWQQHSKLIRYSFPLNPYSQEEKNK